MSCRASTPPCAPLEAAFTKGRQMETLYFRVAPKDGVPARHDVWRRDAGAGLELGQVRALQAQQLAQHPLREAALVTMALHQLTEASKRRPFGVWRCRQIHGAQRSQPGTV